MQTRWIQNNSDSETEANYHRAAKLKPPKKIQDDELTYRGNGIVERWIPQPNGSCQVWAGGELLAILTPAEA